MEPEVQQKLNNYFSKYPQKKFKKGKLILQPQKEINSAFYLTAGSIRMFTITNKGIDTTLNIFKPFSIFPLGPVINNKENLYYYETMNDVVVSIVPKKVIINLLQTEQDITYDLLSRIYKGLDGYFLIMESLLGGSAYHRVVTQLIIQNKRFGKVKLTHAKLASLTGLSRETVTREITNLQKKGVISYKKGAIHITSNKKLEQELV